jgi:hypothetical protein
MHARDRLVLHYSSGRGGNGGWVMQTSTYGFHQGSTRTTWLHAGMFGPGDSSVRQDDFRRIRSIPPVPPAIIDMRSTVQSLFCRILSNTSTRSDGPISPSSAELCHGQVGHSGIRTIKNAHRTHDTPFRSNIALIIFKFVKK